MNEDNIDKTCSLLIDNAELGASIVAAQHLKEASELLKNDEEDISTLLLRLAKYLLDKIQFTDEEMSQIRNVIGEISNGKEK